MLIKSLLAASFLGTLALGAPTPPGKTLTTRAVKNAVENILDIAPSTSSCAGASFPEECRTAEQAAPFLLQAVQDYKLNSMGEIAAILSLLLFESGELKYNKNHFPGRPGQGTRNMQMSKYNYQYAKSIPALASQADAIAPAGVDGLSDESLNALLELVLPDKYSFASAAWFLTTQCSQTVQQDLRSGSNDSYTGYLACIGTEWTSERQAYWDKARLTLGINKET
jgi:hypothetical protein